MSSAEISYVITVQSARAAAGLYITAVVLLLRGRTDTARLVSTAGFTVYLIHVACAFQYFYGWSHSIAYRETARQTADLFGVDWGGGLYLNYLFTLLWLADCILAWMPSLSRDRRLFRARIGVHIFLSFMVLNATIVVWILRAMRG